MKKLYLSKTDKKISGLCGGIGVVLNIDSNIIRVAMVFLCLVTGVLPTVIAYLICPYFVPSEQTENL